MESLRSSGRVAEQDMAMEPSSSESQTSQKYPNVYSVNATASIEWTSFSPPQTAGSRRRPARLPDETSNYEGYRYYFPTSPPDSARLGSKPCSPKDSNPRRWSPPKRSARGWSQFTRESSARESPPSSELSETPDFRHPINPDLTPRRFWDALAEFRQSHSPVQENAAEASARRLPVAGLPQIVPRLNLMPATGTKNMSPQLISEADMDGKDPSSSDLSTNCPKPPLKRHHGAGPLVFSRSLGVKEARNGFDKDNPEIISDIHIRRDDANEGHYHTDPGRLPPALGSHNGHSNFNDKDESANRRRALVGSDEEVMSLQHRKLGIQPKGKIWNLHSQLRAPDKTLEAMQVAAAIMANPNLEELDLRGNDLDGKLGSVLGAVLNDHPRIRVVSGMPVQRIKENDLTEFAMKQDEGIGTSDIALVGIILTNSNSLIKLDLHGVSIDKETSSVLGFAIRKHTNLKYLDLSRTTMTAENFSNIVPGLMQTLQLVQLSLGTNFLEAGSMHALAHVMKKSLQYLQVLDLRNNLLGSHGAAALAPALLSENLTDIDLSNNRIGGPGCAALIWGLKGHFRKLDGLTKLSLSFNGLDIDGARAVICTLPDMRNLKSLKLHSEIPVSDIRSKRDLALAGMGFREIEGVIIAHLLQQNTSLRSLDLRGNEMGPTSCRILSTALITLSQLQKLNEGPFDMSMQPQDVLSILQAGIRMVSRQMTPYKPRQRLTFGRGITVLGNVQKNDFVTKEETDHDDYHGKYNCWKGMGMRPETAAISSDDDDEDDDDDCGSIPSNRPPEFGFYKVGRNARLRQKAGQHKSPTFRCQIPTSNQANAGSSQSRRVPTEKLELNKRQDNSKSSWRGITGLVECDCGSSIDNGSDCASQTRTALTPGSKGLVVDGNHSVSQIGTALASKTGVKSSKRKPKLTVNVHQDSLKSRIGDHKSGLHSKLRAVGMLGHYSQLMPSDVPSTSVRSSISAVKQTGGRSPFCAIFNRHVKVKLHMIGSKAHLVDPASHVLKCNRTCNYAGNLMGPSGAGRLAEELKALPARFASVDLSLNNLTGIDEHGTGELDLAGFKALCRVLRRNNGLESLNLAWNHLCGNAMSILKTVLDTNPCLTTLDLYKNDLREDGIKILASCLEHLPSLRELNLRYNGIGTEGACVFATSLTAVTELVNLDVAGNDLGFVGIQSLTPALGLLSNLTCLHVNENMFGQESYSIVQYILKCPDLVELNSLSLSNLMSEMSQSKPRLPSRLENYEVLYLANQISGWLESNEDSSRFWNLLSAISSCLQTVDLSCCHLTDFPESTLILTSMTSLDVSFNKLERIPVMKVLAHAALVELNCEGNYALYQPPPEIAEQGGKASLYFLREAHKTGMTDDEISLIAIGAESVGKSSCLSCLVRGVGRNVGKINSNPIESEFEDGTPLFHGEPLFDPAILNAVHGLKESSRAFSINDRDSSCLTGSEGTLVANMMYWRAADDLQFFVCDLPGHDMYTATNRLFFRRRAVYLLIWRLENHTSDESMARGMVSVCKDVASWMEYVQSIYPGSNCLVVATHKDVVEAPIAAQQVKTVQSAIKQKLEDMKAASINESVLNFWNDGESSLLCCNEGDGISSLRRNLIAFTKSIQAFKAPYPKAFLQLRNGLRCVRNRHPLIKGSVYKELAQLCGLEGESLNIATSLMHSRGYLIILEDIIRTHRKNRLAWGVKLKTMVRIRKGFSDILNKVQGDKEKKQKVSEKKDDDIQDVSAASAQMVVTSAFWWIRVLRGLLIPDIEMIIDWFSGRYNTSTNFSMIQSLLRYLKSGILERRLVYFLWPSYLKPQHKLFWCAYADRGVGPLRLSEGQMCHDENEYEHLLNLLKRFRVISNLTEASYLVPCMQRTLDESAISGDSYMIADARVFKPFIRGLCSEIRYNFLPSNFFQVFLSCCVDIRDESSNQRIDRIDFSSMAAALYLKGDKAQLCISRAARSCDYRLSLNISSFALARAVQEKLHLAESAYPGIFRLSDEEKNPYIQAGEVPNILFKYSLYAVQYAEIVVDEVQKYDWKYKLASQQVSQFSKILASLSINARDLLRKQHVKTISELREFASYRDLLSQEKMTRQGFDERDSKLVYKSLYQPEFAGQIVIFCIDELYLDDAECDWHSIRMHMQSGAFLILILLPGSYTIEQLPLRPISIVDLRSAEWIREGRDLRLSFESRTKLKNKLHSQITTLISCWRGSLHMVGDFDIPPIACPECLHDGEVHLHRFDYDELRNLHSAFLARRLKADDTCQEEHLVTCLNQHCHHVEDILCMPTEMTATACPGCIAQGQLPPHCFSRQRCVDMLHGKKVYQSQDNKDSLGEKSNLLTLACPQCRSRLDLLDILQADIFVSYLKKKVKCHSCGRAHETSISGGPPGFHRRPSAASGDSSRDGSDDHFYCQECCQKFCESDIDHDITSVRRMIGYVVERLNVISIQPSISYQSKEVTPAGGHVALKGATSAKVFVAFMDANYIKSHACIAEFAAAVQASRYIIPVLLPGYHSANTAGWYPLNVKYKRIDGINMVAPFSVLKHFNPIVVEQTEDGNGFNYNLDLLKGVCKALYGGATQVHRTGQAYEEWRMELTASRRSLLGSWATIRPEDADRKIARIWRRHANALGRIKNIKRELDNVGIKVSEAEIKVALDEISVSPQTMGQAEFRQFMWNLISNITIKLDGKM